VAFRGQYEHSLDAKDRLTIPARYRAALDEGVVLLESLDPCVALYPTAEYARFADRFLAGLNPLSKRARMMKRRFHAHAHDERLDSAGRVRLPRHLVESAGLEGTCLIVGVDDHLEVWSPGQWAKHDAEISDQAERLAEELAAEGGTGEGA
jgi:MraZ protein